MSRLHLREVVVVEGKYDAIALSNVVDALIVTTNGFSVFSSRETKQLIRTLGAQRGVVILTDSDAAGFRIRAYVNQLAAGLCVKNAYVPAIAGKESRKGKPSKEGLLGVEGMRAGQLLQALEQAGIYAGEEPPQNSLSYADLYELGLSGTPESADLRRRLLKELSLPPRLSKRDMLEVLRSLSTRSELESLIRTLKKKEDD